MPHYTQGSTASMRGLCVEVWLLIGLILVSMQRS